jgi:radical SAM superfamily enzyme YgiQ (UPF0313 family)
LRAIKLIPPIINPYPDGRNDYFMPLGLLAIAASLQLNDYSVSIYKPKKRIINLTDYARVAKEILSEEPELIGFSTWCITYPSSLIIAQQLKLLSPATPVVFGGPQASVLPEKTLRNFPFVDYVLSGEADNSFPLFLQELKQKPPSWNNVPGLTFRNGSGKICTTPLGKPILNLDELPVPSYSMIKEKTSIKLDVGRGCPFHCTFCSTSNFFSKKYRVKTTDRIINEMNSVFIASKIRKFNFAHDLFTLNRKFVIEFCSTLIQQNLISGINYNWTCSARTDCVDTELLIKMKAAGCESVFFGIESGSEKIQKSTCKNLKLYKVYQVADACRQAGMDMHASFIAGFPDETNDDLEKTLRCALKLSVKGAMVQISELSLLPGTPLFNRFHTYLKFDGFFSNFSNSLSNPEEVKLMRKFPDIFSSFYYLPVDTLPHNEMYYLCRMINVSSYFRNTIYLLKEVIEHDLQRTNLLQLFKSTYISWKRNGELHHQMVSLVVNLIRNYISSNKHRIEHKELTDVFSFEAFQALLTIQYNQWQIVKDHLNTIKPDDREILKPIPSWKVLYTSYNLDRIIPEEHNWNCMNHRIRKRCYRYLLIVETDVKCRRVRINSTDEFLLNLLSETNPEAFIKLACSKLTEAEARLWLKKMKKLGVVEITSSV